MFSLCKNIYMNWIEETLGLCVAKAWVCFQVVGLCICRVRPGDKGEPSVLPNGQTCFLV